MKKVIVVESCKTCPYIGYYKRAKQYICMMMSLEVTSCLNDDSIHKDCKLDEAIIDQKTFSSPQVISSEGTAICKSIPVEDSFTTYIVGEQYSFKRQVDGNIRLYNYGVDAPKYILYPHAEFEKYFQIEGESNVDTEENEVCQDCGRPKQWCECL